MDLECQNFWTRVKNVSKALKMTQEQLCNEVGINLQTYKGWKVYGRYPSAIEIVRIAKALNTTAEYLVSGNETKLPDDIQTVNSKLLKFSEEERKPILAIIDSQVDFWTKTLHK